MSIRHSITDLWAFASKSSQKKVTDRNRERKKETQRERESSAAVQSDAKEEKEGPFASTNIGSSSGHCPLLLLLLLFLYLFLLSSLPITEDSGEWLGTRATFSCYRLSSKVVALVVVAVVELR